MLPGSLVLSRNTAVSRPQRVRLTFADRWLAAETC